MREGQGPEVLKNTLVASFLQPTFPDSIPEEAIKHGEPYGQGVIFWILRYLGKSPVLKFWQVSFSRVNDMPDPLLLTPYKQRE